MEKNNDLMETIVSFTKRRGFVYPSSEIYGGFANSYDYGPLGVLLKNNIRDLWWKMFVTQRRDIVGLDGSIILNPKVWDASGHTAGFNDAMVDCKKCRARYRADHLIEDALDLDVEGKSNKSLTDIIVENKVQCPKCGKSDFTDVRSFNMMFKTNLATTGEGDDDIAYLRPETAQAIFINYKNVLDTMHMKIPFGIAQVGKAFRNEITPGNFTFRTLEFEQMEIEYFIKEENWKESFEEWKGAMEVFVSSLGIDKKNIRFYEHPVEKLSHYSKRTVDIEYNYPFGFKELYGLAYRTDYDLKQHQEYSGQKMEYFDQVNNKKFIPHVVEPTFGLTRTVLAVLLEAYTEETLKNSKGENETRVVLKLDKKIAPYKVAVLPLSKKSELAGLSNDIWETLSKKWQVDYDETQSIGKRYRRQDEIGTPYCVTVDFDSLEDKAVTIRDRDSMKQDRIAITELEAYLEKKLV